MQRQRHHLLGILSLTLLAPCLGHAQDSIDTIVSRLYKGDHVSLTDISPEERPQVILAIKKFLKENPTDHYPYPLIEMLVMLRDDETIRDLVNQYNQSPFSREPMALGNAANSEIIQYVASDLSFRKWTAPQAEGDVAVDPPRIWAARLILLCIAKSPEFPAKTQAWAHGMHGKDDDWWLAAEQWWTHNKDAVMAKHYSEATWLPPQK
jgi:hypothetical protein